MKILSAAQFRSADANTIKHEGITSFNLMERAASSCFALLVGRFGKEISYTIICGKGNNGGDGLVIAQCCKTEGMRCEVFVIDSDQKASEDFNKSLELATKAGVVVKIISNADEIEFNCDWVLDAIFGTGLNRPVEGIFKSVIERINSSGKKIISIDVPSGLFTDSLTNGIAVESNSVFTFECPKLAFMFSENERYVKEFQVVYSVLNKEVIDLTDSKNYYLESSNVSSLIKSRNKFSHKGDFGKGLLISGSKGKIGAAVLASRACLRSGIGLLTIYSPECGYTILQTSVPEAMMISDSDHDHITEIPSTDNYDAIGIGPGIGVTKETTNAVIGFFKECKKPLVIDADAINIIAQNYDLFKYIRGAILTPHQKEFERLARVSSNSFERHEKQVQFSKQHGVYVVLKGAHTCITTPEGKSFFNSTGNPGMAKGGSGDALTGIILAFLAQGYSAEEACIISVYIHGSAGDSAAAYKGEYSIICSDLIEEIPSAIQSLKE